MSTSLSCGRLIAVVQRILLYAPKWWLITAPPLNEQTRISVNTCAVFLRHCICVPIRARLRSDTHENTVADCRITMCSHRHSRADAPTHIRAFSSEQTKLEYPSEPLRHTKITEKTTNGTLSDFPSSNSLFALCGVVPFRLERKIFVVRTFCHTPVGCWYFVGPRLSVGSCVCVCAREPFILLPLSIDLYSVTLYSIGTMRFWFHLAEPIRCFCETVWYTASDSIDSI